ncbi:hypothetical protein ABPG72_006039 [Tetrahymena utriculariae]
MFMKFTIKTTQHFLNVIKRSFTVQAEQPILVNGNKISKDVLQKVKERILSIRERVNIREPKLAIILVGNAADSVSYVSVKQRACKRVGVQSELIHLPETATQKEVIQIVEDLNKREDVDSILTQLPFPAQISKTIVINQIEPSKDVDGLQRCFLTKQLIWDDHNNRALPCTPQSCLHILDTHQIDVKGKQVVMLGKGLLVGSPLGAILLGRGAIVSMCDKKSDLSIALKDADILVSATGVRKLVRGEQLKKGVIVIDVGCSRPLPHEDQSSIVGDVELESVILKASLITPVPGGVGPVTVSMLIQNVVNQWERNNIAVISKALCEDIRKQDRENIVSTQKKQQFNNDQIQVDDIKENVCEEEFGDQQQEKLNKIIQNSKKDIQIQ